MVGQIGLQDYVLRQQRYVTETSYVSFVHKNALRVKKLCQIGSTLNSGEEILLISGRGLHLLKYLGMSNEGKKV